MARKRADDPYPVEFETFRDVAGFTLASMQQDIPSCFNGIVRVRKLRVRVEVVEEPVSVIQDRIRKLWDECTNNHSREPIFAAGMKYGIDLRGPHGQPNPPATPDPQAQ